MINAEGEQGEKATFGKPSAWIDYYGKRGNNDSLEGDKIEITASDFPGNVSQNTVNF